MAYPRRSERLQKEGEFVAAKLGAGEICVRCHATLDNFAEVCSADLADACPGFLAIDSAKAEFGRSGVSGG